MITYLTDDLCQVIHSPDPDRAETKQWRAGSLWSVFPDEARITISVQLLRDSAGGWRTKSGHWVRTVEEVEADLTETFGRAVDADEYERGLPIAPVGSA
jgi:hypothetical protein